MYASLVDKFSRLCKFSRFTSLVDDTTLVDFNFTSLVDSNFAITDILAVN